MGRRFKPGKRHYRFRLRHTKLRQGGLDTYPLIADGNAHLGYVASDPLFQAIPQGGLEMLKSRCCSAPVGQTTGIVVEVCKGCGRCNPPPPRF